MSPTPRLEILKRIEFGDGKSFGDAGPYELLTIRAHYAVDPGHSGNRDITDMALAPVASDGLVHFSGDVAILKPKDLTRGNRRVFFEFVNRGNKRALQFFGDAPQTNDPRTFADAGDGFLLRRGYTVVWAGWQGDNLPGNERLLIDLPVAISEGKPVTGRIAVEFFNDRAAPVYSLPLCGYISTRSHPTTSMDPRDAVLTRRRYQNSEREVVPPDGFAFARFHGDGAPTPLITEGGLVAEQVIIPSATDLFIKDGFQPGWLYELVYTASSPLVLGLGHAAVRDLISHLRYDTGAGNPLSAAPVEKVYSWGRSQTGRHIRDYIYRGFNADTSNRRVFDGMLSHIAGAGRLDMNRFGNLVISSSRRHEAHYNPSDRFPFSYASCTDHLTGKTDAILKRPDTDPLVIHTHTASEYWYRRASLVHTDTKGNDLDQPDTVRIYHWSSSQHWANPLIPKPNRGVGTNYINIVMTSLLFRPLVDMMDAWASKGKAPPPSRYPQRKDGTLVPYAEWRKQFPVIPGTYIPGGPNELEHLDFGPRADQGIFDKWPPDVVGDGYTVLVPAVDADGNDIAGVRAPMVQAPLGTYTGWNVRARGYSFGATYNFVGSYIPFPDTDEEREMLGDPRPSILGRYKSKDGYQKAIAAAANRLVKDGFLLAEDVDRTVAGAANWSRPVHDVRL